MLCDSTEGLTTEHIIPYSLGGRFELPEACCKACQQSWHAKEGRVSGGMLGQARRLFGIQSRKRGSQKRSQPTASLTLEFQNGKIKKLEIPLEHAPVIYSIPQFLRDERRDEDGKIYSASQLYAEAKQDSEIIFQRIIEKTGAISITAQGGGCIIDEFIQVLWKMVLGFILIERPEIARINAIQEKVNGPSKNLLIPGRMLRNGRDGDGAFVLDIWSEPVNAQFQTQYGSASLYTKADEGHEKVYCRVSFMSCAGFPDYIVVMKNTDGNPSISRTFQMEQVDYPSKI